MSLGESICTGATISSSAAAILLLLLWRPQPEITGRRGISAQLERRRCPRVLNTVLAFVGRPAVPTTAAITMMDRGLMVATSRRFLEINILAAAIRIKRSTPLATNRGRTSTIDRISLSGVWPCTHACIVAPPQHSLEAPHVCMHDQ